MSKQVNYNENLVAGAAIRDDKGRRISKLFEASHPKMTVGYAKNLIMPDTPTEQEFNFRQAGGGVIEDGVAVIDKVKGNSVVWNQLVNHIAPQVSGDTANLTCTREADGRYKIVLSAQVTKLSNIVFAPIVSTGIRAGHKYMCKYGESDNLAPHIGYSNSNGVWWQWTPTGLAALDSIATPSETTDLYGTLYVGSTLPAGTYYFLPALFDLTLMFGAGNEPTTVEEFLQRKPKVADEFAYNEGTIISNSVDSIETVGRNVWEETPNFHDTSMDSGVVIPILPNTQYCITCKRGPDHGYPDIKFFEENPGTNWNTWTSTIYATGVSVEGYHVFTTPANCHYMVFVGWSTSLYGTTTYQNDICINLSDPAINGQYFPYEKHELDLSWVKEIKDTEGVKLFEDGMKSAGTVFDEVRKNKAVKRVGSVDLGSLIWTIDSRQRFEATIPNTPNKKPAQSTDIPNALLIGYLTDSGANMYNHVNDKTVGFDSNGKVKVYDTSYTSLVDFQTAMQGQNLYYELAEPIEVEYDEKNLTYPVIAGGTEEAIASESSTAFRAGIGYGIDAVKTILDLKARVEALEAK